MAVHLSKKVVPHGYFQYEFEDLINFSTLDIGSVKLRFHNINPKYIGNKICIYGLTSNTIFYSLDTVELLVSC